MERGENSSGIDTVNWYLKTQLITKKSFISYLRIRTGTGDIKAKKRKKKNLMTRERNSIITNC